MMSGQDQPRVIVCGGGMVIISGMERLTFEVVRSLRSKGVAVHFILNSWGNERIHPVVDELGASWSTGRYSVRFDRHTRNPLRILRLAWDILLTSLAMLRDSFRFRATHVLLPEIGAVVRNAPALALLRLLGRTVIMRVPNAPERGRFYEHLWRFLVSPLVTRIVVNSEFSSRRCLESGVPAKKIELIRNCISSRAHDVGADEDLVRFVKSGKTLLSVGQIAPFKGTHLSVEAALALLERGFDLKLVVAGRHPDWPPEYVEYLSRLVDEVKDRGLESRVHFVGEVENVLAVMGAAYLLLAPILQEETFGNVLLEAKSVGLPVVAFATGGLPELVEHEKTGYLCEGQDSEGLLKGIEFFLESDARWKKAKKASQAAFEAASSKYSAHTFVERWSDVFAVDPSSADARNRAK